MGVDLPAPGGILAGINSHHDTLRTIAVCSGIDEAGILQRGGIDGDLVGACIEQTPHILDPAHTAPNRERDKDFAGDRFDHGKNQITIIARRSNV